MPNLWVCEVLSDFNAYTGDKDTFLEDLLNATNMNDYPVVGHFRFAPLEKLKSGSSDKQTIYKHIWTVGCANEDGNAVEPMTIIFYSFSTKSSTIYMDDTQIVIDATNIIGTPYYVVYDNSNRVIDAGESTHVDYFYGRSCGYSFNPHNKKAEYFNGDIIESYAEAKEE